MTSRQVVRKALQRVRPLTRQEALLRRRRCRCCARCCICPNPCSYVLIGMHCCQVIYMEGRV